MTPKAIVVEIRPNRFCIRKLEARRLTSGYDWWSGCDWTWYMNEAKVWWTKAKADRQCALINRGDL